MQDYELILKAPISDSFLAKKAAQSVDLDCDEKAYHKINIKNVNIKSDYNVGLIVGSSGSGKTTLAVKIFGKFDDNKINKNLSVIDQFPDHYEYGQISSILNSIGLSQIPCWIKPLGMLSNGQQERAKVALALSSKKELYKFDEWTSVVDRNVAIVMSHSVQKFVRKNNKKIILCSCHHDVIDWLNPDWIIDCNEEKFIDRRKEVQTFERKKKINFSVRKVDKKTWRNFSKYHYLSSSLPGGYIETFGLFLNDKQVGFQCFANYVPDAKGKKRILHSNRVVVHPDYVGLGLGLKMVNECSEILVQEGYKIMIKFSSMPMLKAILKCKKWIFKKKMHTTAIPVGNGMKRKTGFRRNVTTYSFEYVGEKRKFT